MKFNTPLRQFSVLGFLALIWGSSFILMKRGLESFSPEEVAQYRLFIAGVALLPFAIRGLKKFPTSAKERAGLVMVAIFGNFLPAFLFAEAQTQLPSGVTGMLNSLVPLFTLTIGILVFKIESKLRQLMGVALGLFGALMLVYFTSDSSGGIPVIHSSMVIAASLCYAISVNTIKAWLHDVPSVLITSFAFLIIIPVSGAGLFAGDFWSMAFSDNEHLTNLGYISILGLAGTALALLIFNDLIKSTSAVFASSVTYLIPIVAMGWGMVDGEIITFFHLTGMLLILSGVYMVNKKN